MSLHERELSLYCVSPKGEEFIAKVVISDNNSNHDNKLLLSNKFIIKDYTKDFKFLITSTDYIQYKLIAINETDSKSLIKFGNYLFQRQKAGIYYLNDDDGNDSTLNASSVKSYIMPPHSADQAYLFCKVKSSINRGLPVDGTSHHNNSRNNSQNNTINTVGNDLRVDNDTVKVTLAKGENHIQILEDHIKNELKKFDTNTVTASTSSTPLINSIKFKAMDKSDRYIVHDIIQFEYPDLLSASVGDGDDRYVIVYRKGMEPAELAGSTAHLILGDNKNDIQVVPARKINTTKLSNTSYGKAPVTASSQLAPVKTIKRDRRSMDEMLQEIKRKKQLLQEQQLQTPLQSQEPQVEEQEQEKQHLQHQPSQEEEEEVKEEEYDEVW